MNSRHNTIMNDLDIRGLRTSSSFDRGESSTMAVGIRQPCFSLSSLFIESLIEQICKLMDEDPGNQRQLYLTVCRKLEDMHLVEGSYSIDEFGFIRSRYQKSLYNLLIVAKQTILENKTVVSIPSYINIDPDHLQEPSRYKTEFIQLSFIARGGFGHVFKARHKLDGNIYAIKTILLRCKNITSFKSNLMEVKMLARLHHPHIVAYKAAWLEPVTVCNHFEHPSATSSTSISSQSPLVENNVSQNYSPDVIFKSSSLSNESVATSSNSEMQICEINFRKKIIGKNEHALLYIQMQYCSQTLRHWIDSRNNSNTPVDIKKSLQIFKQILAGLRYIHSQNIVHHDIKPSNIFISEDEDTIQVGDFGLACGHVHFGILNNLEIDSSLVAPHRPGRIGTVLYAAPEQLKGVCNPKSDIFSLGIVLFELIVPFHTSMEKNKVIGKLKNHGEVPINLEINHSELVTILKRMVSNDSSRRPSASELLASVEDLETQNAQKITKEQQALINSLSKDLLAKEEKIVHLEELVKNLIQKIAHLEQQLTPVTS